MSYLTIYYKEVKGILEQIIMEEKKNIENAAKLLAEAIENNRMIHVLGTGHSMIIAEEMFLRAGGLVPINAILDRNISIMSGIASTLNERTPGLAPKLLKKYNVSKGDVLIVSSVSGINAVPVEAAYEGKKIGVKVIAITSVEASSKLQPRNPLNKRLYEIVDVVIDMKVPMGDALISLPEMKYKIAPVSTIAGAFIVNCIVIETVRVLLEKGIAPPVWVSSNVPGSDEINMKYVDKYLGRIAHLGVEALLKRMRKEEKKEEVVEKKTPQKIVLYGTLVTPYTIIHDGAIVISDGKIVDLGQREFITVPSDANIYDFRDCYILPGFIDTHIHGCEGANTFDGSLESLKNVALKLVKHGVIGFLPTAVAMPMESLLRVTEAVGTAMTQDLPGARILGLNIEGPFVNPEKKGALIVGFMRKPDLEEMKELFNASKGSLRIVTIAPELEGALDVIKWLSLHGVIVSFGHTNARYEDAIKGFNAGGRLVTHLFNAMREYHHRDPGIIGAALTRDDVFVEIIADGIHVDPAAIKMVIKAKNYDKILIISDATPLAGFPDGEYTFPGFPKITIKNGKATLPDGTLAGSTLTLDKALKNLVNWGIPIEKAALMLSTNKARLLNLPTKGELKVGYDADMVILNKDFEVLMTIVEGTIAYKKLKEKCGH